MFGENYKLKNKLSFIYYKGVVIDIPIEPSLFNNIVRNTRRTKNNQEYFSNTILSICKPVEYSCDIPIVLEFNKYNTNLIEREILFHSKVILCCNYGYIIILIKTCRLDFESRPAIIVISDYVILTINYN